MRSFSLPYKRTNPRTVRGAKKRGWTVVTSGKSHRRNGEVVTSWVGLNIWCERSCRGYWVSSHFLGEFAFEDGADATAFTMKFGQF